MEIKLISPDQRSEAIALVFSVFMEFEAPDYSAEGIQAFERFIHDHEEIEHLAMYGAYEGDELCGVIATRKNGNHISLFFIPRQHQGKGIGRALFTRVIKENHSGTITVNSSPYAVPIYEHLGFIRTDVEQITDGIRYTPMIYTVSSDTIL